MLSFLDRFWKPTPDRFAALLIRTLRAAGVDDELRYDREQFRIVRMRNGDSVGVQNLGNLYRTYLAKPRAERPAYLRICVRSATATGRDLPDDFESARPDIRLKLWLRATLEELRLRTLLEGGDGPINLPGEAVGEHLLACPVYDWPECSRSISAAELAQWEVTPYQALEVARENLAESLSGIAQVGRLFVIATGDSYDAARLTLTDRARMLEVEGRHVAMVPNRDTLLITGSDDQDGLTTMIAVAEQKLDEPYPLCGVPLILDDDGWNDWMPPEEHPLYAAFRSLELRWIGPQYTAQKELLEAIHQASGVDLFVASFSAVAKKSGGHVSYCVWGEGVDSLLPVTQKVIFVRQGEQEFAALGDWDRVRELAGDLMEPTEHYPPRYRVRELPDAETLAKIGTGEL